MLVGWWYVGSLQCTQRTEYPFKGVAEQGVRQRFTNHSLISELTASWLPLAPGEPF